MADIFDKLDVFDEVANQPSSESVEFTSTDIAPKPLPVQTPTQPPSQLGVFDRLINAIAPLGESLAYAYPAPGAGAAPLPQTMAQAQGQIKGIEEAGIAGVRYGAPLAAIPLTGGMGVVPAALTLAGAGAASEVAAQGLEMAQGARPQGIEPKEVAIAGAMNLGGRLLQPVALARTGIGRVGAAGVSGFGAGLGKAAVERGPELARDIGQGEYQKAIMDEVLPGLFESGQTAGLGMVLGSAAESIRAAIAAGGAPSGQRVARAFAELFRPTQLNQAQLAALQSRNAVRVNTTGTGGPIDVDPAISEVIGNGQLARDLRDIQGSENTPETLDRLLRQALFLAARTPPSARSAEDVSGSIATLLNLQNTAQDQIARNAVNAYSRMAVAAVNNAEADIAATGGRLFPQGVSRREAGQILRQLNNDAFDAANREWTASYNAARAIPGYATELVDAQPIIDEATTLGVRFVRDGRGGFTLLSAPPGTASTIQAAESLPNTMTIEQTRNLITTLAGSLRDKSRFSRDIADFVRQRLLSTAHDELSRTVSQVPELDAALRAANTQYRQNIPRFRSRFAESSADQFGEEGGMAPEAIVDKLLGPQADSYVDELQFILGRGRGGVGTAGGDRSDQGINILREAILQRARITGLRGQTSGAINVANAFKVIENLPEGVQQLLFPNLQPFRDAVEREAALVATRNQIRGGAQGFIQAMTEDPTEFNRALGAVEATDLRNRAAQLVANQEAYQARLRAQGLRELDRGDAFRLLDFMDDGANVGRLQNLRTQLIGNPALLNETRAEFFNRLIERSQNAQGLVDPQEMVRFIQPQIVAPVGGVPQPAGRYANQLDILFDPDEVARVRAAVNGLAGLQAPIAQAGPIGRERSNLGWVFLGTPGTARIPASERDAANQILGLFNRFRRAIPEIRYRALAHFLADGASRRAALQPLGEDFVRAVDSAVNLTANDLARMYGKDSAIAKEARSVEESIPNR